MVWVASSVIWVSTLVFTGWVFLKTGSPWSFAILLLLSGMSMDGGDTKEEIKMKEVRKKFDEDFKKWQETQEEKDFSRK